MYTLSPNIFTLRAALFDLDGTLVRTFIDFPAMREAMHALSERNGTRAETHGEDDILQIVETMASAVAKRRGDAAGSEIRREAFAVLEVMEAEGCARAEPIAGARELLNHLRGRQIPVAIITRNCRTVALDLIRQQDLWCNVLLAREDTREFKPHPAPVLRACELLGVAPANAVMVGDLWADIAAGRAAGVGRTVGIQWDYDPPQRFARSPPDAVVGSLEEAAAFLLHLPNETGKTPT